MSMPEFLKMTVPVRRFAAFPAAGLLWLAMLGILPGCAAGLLSNIRAGTHQPVYELIDQPTLVFVQVRREANAAMGHMALRSAVAAQVERDLKDKKLITTFIPHGEVIDLSIEMGEKFEDLAVDEIGRKLGAKQVIIVDIESVKFRPHPGLLEPTVQSRVRIIDAENRERLFPKGEAFTDDPDLLPPGHSVLTQLPRKQDDQVSQQDAARILRILALAVGQDVGRLFYKWNERDEGEIVY